MTVSSSSSSHSLYSKCTVTCTTTLPSIVSKLARHPSQGETDLRRSTLPMKSSLCSFIPTLTPSNILHYITSTTKDNRDLHGHLLAVSMDQLGLLSVQCCQKFIHPVVRTVPVQTLVAWHITHGTRPTPSSTPCSLFWCGGFSRWRAWQPFFHSGKRLSLRQQLPKRHFMWYAFPAPTQPGALLVSQKGVWKSVT